MRSNEVGSGDFSNERILDKIPQTRHNHTDVVWEKHLDDSEKINVPLTPRIERIWNFENVTDFNLSLRRDDRIGSGDRRQRHLRKI